MAEDHSMILDRESPPVRVVRKAFRACHECRRKKSRCDMRLPICTRCERAGDTCVFPARRKAPVPRSKVEKPAQTSQTSANTQGLNQLAELVASRLAAAPSASSNTLEPLPPAADQPPELQQQVPISPLGTRLESMPPMASPLAYPSTSGKDLESPRSWGSGPTNATGATASDTTVHLGLPTEVASDLVRVYFDTIQTWLPMLHRPRFYGRFMTGASLSKMDGYSLEEGLLLHGMFALAARHSRHPYFPPTDLPNRGQPYAAKAMMLYDKARHELEPSLTYLQGCILLAFYMGVAQPGPRSWILTGVCVRMAYELELDVIDDLDLPMPAASQWSEHEEFRRAWWLVWELDTFCSTVTERPFCIDRRRVSVRLPVSDDAWFADAPLISPVISTKPSELWKTLQDSGNQSERAWFLVANVLLMLAADLTQRGNRDDSAAERDELASGVTCFSLLLAKRRRMDTHSVSQKDSPASRNWLLGAQLFITTVKATLHPFADHSVSEMQPRLSMAAEYRSIISNWPPDDIPLSHPFIACTMLPAARSSGTIPNAIHEDMCSLVLGQFAEIWPLGAMLQKLRSLMKCHRESWTTEDLRLARQYAAYFPDLSRSSSFPRRPSGMSVPRLQPSQAHTNAEPGVPLALQSYDFPITNTDQLDFDLQDFDPTYNSTNGHLHEVWEFHSNDPSALFPKQTTDLWSGNGHSTVFS